MLSLSDTRDTHQGGRDMSDTTQRHTATVVRLAERQERQWFTRSELAAQLGVSVRTIDRRASAGLIERRDTPEGKRYRLASDSDSDNRATATTARQVSDKSDSDNATSATGERHTATRGATCATRGNLALALEVDVDTDAAPELAERVAELEDQLSEIFDVAATALEHAEHWREKAIQEEAFSAGLREALRLLKVA